MNQELLILQIEYYRLELVKVGMDKGFASAETIRLSQKLDRLILKHQHLRLNGNHTKH